MLEVKITPIFNTVGVVFQQWAYDRLNGTLGTLPGSEHSQSGQQIQRAGGPPDNSGATVTALQSVAGVLQQMQQQWSGGGAGGVATATTNTPTLSKKDMFNDWQVAAIKGWSCVKETTRIQRFWQTIQGVKQDQIIRTEVRRGMDAWAKWKGQQIETGVYLPKDIIECIRKVTPCPGEPIPTFANADKGIGPLACRPWRSDEIELEQEKERAAEATAATRTTNKCRVCHKWVPSDAWEGLDF